MMSADSSVVFCFLNMLCVVVVVDLHTVSVLVNLEEYCPFPSMASDHISEANKGSGILIMLCYGLVHEICKRFDWNC